MYYIPFNRQLLADKYLLGTMCWKWTGDELQALESFLRTSLFIAENLIFLNI